jgi:hypothetical protein
MTATDHETIDITALTSITGGRRTDSRRGHVIDPRIGFFEDDARCREMGIRIVDVCERTLHPNWFRNSGS